MTASDIQQWERTKEVAQECGLKVYVDRGVIRFTRISDKCELGGVQQVVEAYHFALGYSWGIHTSKPIKRTKTRNG